MHLEQRNSMNVEIQLFSILRELLPPGARRGRATITLADGATVADLITQLGIDQKMGFAPEDMTSKAGWQVMVSDKFEADMGRILQDGDQVKILPPVSGG
jgi:molybdopterin converting factor small subunit